MTLESWLGASLAIDRRHQPGNGEGHVVATGLCQLAAASQKRLDSRLARMLLLDLGLAPRATGVAVRDEVAERPVSLPVSG